MCRITACHLLSLQLAVSSTLNTSHCQRRRNINGYIGADALALLVRETLFSLYGG